MKELISKFCSDNSRSNGLLLIDMPTGMGKTYSVTKYIAENYNKIVGKIFFITQLKKNLPEEDLRKRFKEMGKDVEFEKLFLRVENNIDNLCEHFEDVKKYLFQYIKDKQLIKKIEREVKIINIKNSYASDDYWLLVQQAREDLSEVSEKKLRELVTAYLKYDEEGNERTKNEKKRLIEEDEAYRWIGMLYPTVFTEDRKIILMSLDKFLLRYSTIIEPSFNLFESKYIKDGVIFIDEFDTTKEVILRRIIQNGLINKVGIVNIFRTIYSGLFDTGFTKILTEQSKQFSSEKFKPITGIIETFKTISKEIMGEHNLGFLHKLQDEFKDSVSFLFQDYKLHTLVDGENKYIAVDLDKEKNVNWLSISSKESVEDTSNSIYKLIVEINGFLNYFQTGVRFIADNYLSLKKERKQGDFNITLESAIRTALAEFGIYGTMQKYLTYNIMLSKKSNRSINSIKETLDSSIYEKGFRYYQIVDDDNHDTQSQINYVAFNDSPEKFLIRLIERTKVVGVSASAKLPTVLANYDLEYLKKEHRSLMVEPEGEDIKRINAEFQKSISNYDNTKIHCSYVGVEKELSAKVKEIFNEFAKVFDTEDYRRDRFLCFTEVFDKFLQNKNIKSMLYFSNSRGQEFEIEGENILLKFLDEAQKAYGIEVEVFVLYGNNETFERRKENMFKALKEGKKVFVISTYGTMGAGQNIHYEFDSSVETELVRINEATYNRKTKDFDAIYLETPTNVLVNTSNRFDSDEEFIKYIYQIKFLQEVGNLTVTEGEYRIRNAFNLFSGAGGFNRNKHPKNSRHFNMAYAKIALQAIGRICRTSNKRRNIYIFYQKSFAEKIKPIADYFEDKLLNPEFREFLKSCKQIAENTVLLSDEQVLVNKAENIIMQSNQLIDSIVGNWTVNNITYWEAIREAVLKQPTADDLNCVQFPMLYVELPKKANKYFIGKFKNTTHVSFEYNGDDDFNCIDEKYVGLDKVLSIPGIKDFFIKSGYATYFQEGKYILAQNVFKRIYQGALGEVVGRHILSKLLLRYTKTTFNPLPKEIYEKFDGRCKDVYFDFKLWTSFDKLYQDEISKIRKKMYDCKARKAIFVNIFKPKGINVKPYNDGLKDPILILPYLYDLEQNKWNNEGIKKLYEILIETDSLK